MILNNYIIIFFPEEQFPWIYISTPNKKHPVTINILNTYFSSVNKRRSIYENHRISYFGTIYSDACFCFGTNSLSISKYCFNRQCTSRLPVIVDDHRREAQFPIGQQVCTGSGVPEYMTFRRATRHGVGRSGKLGRFQCQRNMQKKYVWLYSFDSFRLHYNYFCSILLVQFLFLVYFNFSKYFYSL